MLTDYFNFKLLKGKSLVKVLHFLIFLISGFGVLYYSIFAFYLSDVYLFLYVFAVILFYLIARLLLELIWKLL